MRFWTRRLGIGVTDYIGWRRKGHPGHIDGRHQTFPFGWTEAVTPCQVCSRAGFEAVGLADGVKMRELTGRILEDNADILHASLFFTAYIFYFFSPHIFIFWAAHPWSMMSMLYSK